MCKILPYSDSPLTRCNYQESNILPIILESLFQNIFAFGMESRC